MDELEGLKNKWAKQSFRKKYTDKELNQLLTKKSTSNIRWIFYLSIGEFILYMLFPILVPNYGQSFEYYRSIHLYGFAKGVTYMGYGLLLYFSFRFFQNYRSISVSDSIKGHLSAILKTRKSVNLYILSNLVLIFIFLTVVMISSIEYDPSYKSLNNNNDVSWYLILLIIMGVIIVLTAFLGLIYYLVYGRFLASLKRNEKELMEANKLD